MFKFLFRNRPGAAPAAPESQRATVLRAQAELNAVLAALQPKAAITIHPENGTLAIALPDQMPDEARALPAPDAEPADGAATARADNG